MLPALIRVPGAAAWGRDSPVRIEVSRRASPCSTTPSTLATAPAGTSTWLPSGTSPTGTGRAAPAGSSTSAVSLSAACMATIASSARRRTHASISRPASSSVTSMVAVSK